MENNRENAIRFFATHLNSKVKVNAALFHANDNSINSDGKTIMSPSILADIHEGTFSYRDFTLIRKPLSSISDEDAIEIAMMLVKWQPSMAKLTEINVRGRQDGDHVWDEVILEFKGSFNYTIKYRGGDFLGCIDSNGHCEWTLFNHRKVYDYLRSKGYYVGDGTEIEYGWIKIIN